MRAGLTDVGLHDDEGPCVPLGVRRFDLARMSRAPKGRRRLASGSLTPAASSSPMAPASDPAQPPQASISKQKLLSLAVSVLRHGH